MNSSEIWYHLYPLGFLGAEERNPAPGSSGSVISHRLANLTGWLDYLLELGVTGLLLGPICESETHGYDTVDAMRVDRRLGDAADFSRLVEACHQRSIKVGLDLVLNHVGRAHPHFLDVIERRRDSAWRDWFVVDFEKPGHDGFQYQTFEGHGGLVKLNHANPKVLDWAVDVAQYWLSGGVDAFRLDAAYAIAPRFLSKFADRIAEARSDITLVGEVIHGDYVGIARASHLTTVTQYELWKAVWSSLNDRNLFELAHALERHAAFCRRFPPWTFLGNHDTTRIASKLNDRRHLSHAFAILFTVPGIASIYAGDEQGVEGVKYDREGGDAEIRKPLPVGPAEMTHHPTDIWTLHRELIAVRRARPWLAQAELVVRKLQNASIVMEICSKQQCLIVGLNIGDAAYRVDLPAGMDAVAGCGQPDLPPHSWGIWAGGKRET